MLLPISGIVKKHGVINKFSIDPNAFLVAILQDIMRAMEGVHDVTEMMIRRVSIVMSWDIIFEANIANRNQPNRSFRCRIFAR